MHFCPYATVKRYQTLLINGYVHFMQYLYLIFRAYSRIEQDIIWQDYYDIEAENRSKKFVQKNLVNDLIRHRDS